LRQPARIRLPQLNRRLIELELVPRFSQERGRWTGFDLDAPIPYLRDS
jgi:hypothetical protein